MSDALSFDAAGALLIALTVTVFLSAVYLARHVNER